MINSYERNVARLRHQQTTDPRTRVQRYLTAARPNLDLSAGSRNAVIFRLTCAMVKAMPEACYPYIADAITELALESGLPEAEARALGQNTHRIAGS